jgi:hypothetical protein
LTANTTYALVSVSLATCSQPQSGSAVITISSPPTATISGSTTICSGSSTTITFNGTPNATVTYTVNGGSNQAIVLDALGTATLNTGILTADTTFSLVSVQVGSDCSANSLGSVTVTILPLPTVTIAGDITICDGQTATITFNGTPNTTVTYNVDASANQTLVLNAAGTNTITTPALSANSVYTLVSVQAAGPNGCQQNVTGTATVTVNALPTATISGSTTVCSGDTAIITFNGTPGATVTYTVGSGGNQTIVLDATGTNTITTAALTADQTYNLVSVSTTGAPACSQNVAGSASISVQTLPVASISGNATTCSGNTANITFTGTPNATVTYTVGGGGNQTVVLDATGNFVLTTPILTATATYDLVSVQDSGSLGCNQTQTGSVVITVLPLPDATVAGTGEICQNGASQVITFTGSNGTAPYTFTYHVNTGADISITSVGNTATVTQWADNSGTFTYYLTSVQSAGTPACTQALNQSATVTVLELPTALISGTASTCQDATEPVITFAGSGGTPPYTFSYNINTGPVQSISTSGTDTSVTLPAPTNVGGTFDYHLVSVLDSGTTQCGQTQTGTATVTILIAPTINHPSDIRVCDDNNDGFSCLFNLTASNAQITGGNLGLTVSYHETPTDAQTGTAPIPNPAAYCNIVAGAQTVYVRVFDPAAPACYSTETLNIFVDPVPVPNPTIPDYHKCDDNAPGDATESFDLTTMDTEILNGQTGITVTYYLSSTDEQHRRRLGHQRDRQPDGLHQYGQPATYLRTP